MPVDVHADVISNVRLSDDYNVLTMAAPEIGELTQPGQFVMVKAGPLPDSILRRPFSVFEVIREGGRVRAISILNKRAGRNTRALYALEAGGRVSCLGPLGKPFSPTVAGEAWLIAGGVGLAPFATLAESLSHRQVQTTLFYGARSARELFYLEFFERLGVTTILSTEDGSRGTHGRVTIPLEQSLAQLPDAGRAMLYACGPEPMLEAVARLAAKYRQPSEVSVERVMGCGLGGCYSCVIPVRNGSEHSHFVRACVTGPVFDGSTIVWEKC
ncbi:MAG TPA: dihydroorotate dehydrogenase electron transfer subunit [Vicinamibacterales bacterium]|nr:dihydroorotate dehydrogenase electron transfer subunit [Vicinamibacterales bacterium]